MRCAGPLELPILLALAMMPASAQPPDDFLRKFKEAERHIVRLPPSAFPGLPSNLRRELERRACTIPQEASSKKPHNVIRGQFAKSGQTDWAVLCSVKGASTILVFWNGSELNPAAIGKEEDRHRLQVVGEDRIGYSREITPAGRDFIMGHYEAYGGPKPPRIDHQGIDDAFTGKASSTLYFHRGKWLCLAGAD